MAKLMLKLNIPLTWITPNGLTITQHYLKYKKTTVAIKFANKTKRVVLREWTEDINKIKQVQAIIPNIIHSLDANHLIELINNSNIQRFGPIITIHDCFGTLPNRMKRLEFMVKKEFIELYSQDNYLQTFHCRILQSIKDNRFEIVEMNNNSYVDLCSHLDFPSCGPYSQILIPKVPKLGSLDLKEIINSKYMIT